MASNNQISEVKVQGSPELMYISRETIEHLTEQIHELKSLVKGLTSTPSQGVYISMTRAASLLGFKDSRPIRYRINNGDLTDEDYKYKGKRVYISYRALRRIAAEKGISLDI